MNPITRERLFGFRHAFDSPVTLWITIAVIAALLIASDYHLVAARWPDAPATNYMMNW